MKLCVPNVRMFTLGEEQEQHNTVLLGILCVRSEVFLMLVCKIRECEEDGTYASVFVCMHSSEVNSSEGRQAEVTVGGAD